MYFFKVVNMLLSCGANPHQTNTRRKKPTDLISTKEMSDIFNLRGILHTGFEKADMKVLSEEIAAAGSTEQVHVHAFVCTRRFLIYVCK
jgi:hypothetical protein